MCRNASPAVGNGNSESAMRLNVHKMAGMPSRVHGAPPRHTARWADEAWSAGVVPDHGNLRRLQVLRAPRDYYLVSGLELELYTDENEGYYENVIAPELKVFVLWRMEEGRAMPRARFGQLCRRHAHVRLRESADGVTIPAEIYAWVAEYLREHYTPRPRRGRQHG